MLKKLVNVWTKRHEKTAAQQQSGKIISLFAAPPPYSFIYSTGNPADTQALMPPSIL